MEELYISVGINKIPTNQLINVIMNDNETKEEIILKKFKPEKLFNR